MALEAEAKNNFQLGLVIIPTAINYTHPTLWGTEAFISCATPIQVANYKALYNELPAKAIAAINEVITQSLENQMIITPHPDDGPSRCNSPS